MSLFDDGCRFFAKVEWSENRYEGTRCLVWTASLRNGYGHLKIDGKTVFAHRWLYERWFGSIPEGLEMDHLCRVRPCVNPDHLEPVTHRENVRRGRGPAIAGARMLAKTHCPRDHPYDDENTYVRPNGSRGCRRCNNDATRRRRG